MESGLTLIKDAKTLVCDSTKVRLFTVQFDKEHLFRWVSVHSMLTRWWNGSLCPRMFSFKIDIVWQKVYLQLCWECYDEGLFLIGCFCFFEKSIRRNI